MTLPEKIADIINGLHSDTPVNASDLKGRLVDFLAEFEAFEEDASSGANAFQATLEKAAFEAQVNNLKAELETLNANHESQVEALRAENKDLAKALDRLRYDLAEREKKSARRTGPEEVLLGCLTHRRKRTSLELAKDAGMGIDVVEGLLDALYQDEFVLLHHYASFGLEPARQSEWSLHPKAQRYLAERGLIE